MVQRTLTALFSLAVLILPASHLYADADMMTSVYSGLECKYLDSYATEGQEMAGGDVVYHSRLGIGNLAERTRDEANPSMAGDEGDMRQYRMSVACPLPSLEYGDMVQVAVIDGTVYDDVTCWVQTCRAGIGLGSNGQGGCMNGASSSTHYVNQAPYTQHANYITQNVDWIAVMAKDGPGTGTEAGREMSEGTQGKAYSHLLCTLPEQDDVSAEAPAIRDEDGMALSEEGISYIQSYYVE
jgi:hypothetical protein